MHNPSLWLAMPPILAYHSVDPHRIDGLSVHPKRFYEQMQWLQRQGLRGVDLSTLVEYKRKHGCWPDDMIGITFDDGYRDNLTHAWPILAKYGFRATVFIITQRVGTDIVHDPDWLTSFPSVPRHSYQYLDWDEVRFLHDHGIEIGSHTCTHRLLDAALPDEQEYEIRKSKEELEMKLAERVKSFCYPVGRFTDKTIAMVRAAGYSQATVTPWRTGLLVDEWLTISRVPVYRRTNLWRFKFRFSPWFECYRSLRLRLSRH